MTPISGNHKQTHNRLILKEINAFLIDRQARHLSPRSINYYSDELNYFLAFLEKQRILVINDLQSQHIREYLIELSTHRNSGGCHAAYRAIRAFLRWYSEEVDNPDFERIIHKVSPPKVEQKLIQGVTMDQVKNLLATCDRSFYGIRDRAILITLLDTGLRRFEMVKLNINDIDFKTGSVMIHSGKGDKDRVVFINAVARREILRYLRIHPDPNLEAPLWVIDEGTRLTAAGLREMLRRRSERVGIPEQSSHDFRRAFGVESLRNGADLESIRRLMGHSDIKTTQRYIKLLNDDLRKAHESSSPADNL